MTPVGIHDPIIHQNIVRETEVLWNNTLTRCNAFRPFPFYFKTCCLQLQKKWFYNPHCVMTHNLKSTTLETRAAKDKLNLSTWMSDSHFKQVDRHLHLIVDSLQPNSCIFPSNPARSLFFLSLNGSFFCTVHMVATSHVELSRTWNVALGIDTWWKCKIHATF